MRALRHRQGLFDSIRVRIALAVVLLLAGSGGDRLAQATGMTALGEPAVTRG
jgi:hypothetical protein